METAVKIFFSSPYFAVAGASQDPKKFGFKILTWYCIRSLPVQPVTPSRSAIVVSSTEYRTVPSPSALPHPRETSLSIVTPPSITLEILREAKKSGIPSVWLQPGSFDNEGLEYAKTEFIAGIGGEGGSGEDGWCLLVDGDLALCAVQGNRNEQQKF